MPAEKALDKKNEKPGTLWLTGRIQSTQQVGTDKENFPIIETSMSQFVNEKRLSMAELQIISGHAKIESVYKYASVELARKRELMETLSIVEPEKIRRAK